MEIRRPASVLVFFLGLLLPIFAQTLGNFSAGYQISPKACQVKGQEGTCMFVWECIKTEGSPLGMCMERFMFGSCCAHDLDNNVVPKPSRPSMMAINQQPLISTATTTGEGISHFPPSPVTTGMSTTSRTSQETTVITVTTPKPTVAGTGSILTTLITSSRPPGTTPLPLHVTTPSVISLLTSAPVTPYWTTATNENITDASVIPMKLSSTASNSSVVDDSNRKPGILGAAFASTPKTRPELTQPPDVSTPYGITMSTSSALDTDSFTSTSSSVTHSSLPDSSDTNSMTLLLHIVYSTTKSPAVNDTPSLTTDAPENNTPTLPAEGVSTSNLEETTTTWISQPTPSPTTHTDATVSSPVIENSYSVTSLPTHSSSPNGTTESHGLLVSTTSASATNTSTSAVDAPMTVFGTSTTSEPLTTMHHTNTINTEHAAITAEKPLVSVTSLPSSNYPNMECGTPPLIGGRQEGRIVGGSTSKFGAWPWQVSVRRTSFFGFSSTHRCGGALLNELWVVTAGHCVEDLLVSQIRLRMGEYDFSSVQEPYPFIERGVNKKIVHPKYNFFTYEYDLALVRLEESIVFQPNVAPICLPASDETLIGENGTVTGWGRLSEGGTLPSILQQVTVPIVSNERCKDMFLKAGRNEYIPDIFMCAGFENGGRDSCQGDSGGPLQIRGKDGRYFLAGIISWGIGCAEANLPGVCTRISKFTSWILENVT